MKKILIIGLITATVIIGYTVKDISISKEGMMIDFVDNTGYWLEF